MLNFFFSKIKQFLAKNSKDELFKDVIAELTDEDTITISIALSKSVYNKLATITFINGHFLLDMSPSTIANSDFAEIVRLIVQNYG